MKKITRIIALTLSCALCLGLSIGSLAAVQPREGFDLDELLENGTTEFGIYTVTDLGDNAFSIGDFTADNPRGIITGPDGARISMNNVSDMYVILGEEKALLLDLSNDHPEDYDTLLGIVMGLAGDREIVVALTHGHPDHVGMYGSFIGSDTPVYIPEADLEMASTFIDTTDCLTFNEGEVFDLGGVVLETVSVIGHTDGSIVFYDRDNMRGFSGDAIGSGDTVWLFGTFEQYQTGLQHLKEVVLDEMPDMTFFGGHDWQSVRYGPKVVLDLALVDDMLALIDIVAAGDFEVEYVNLGMPMLDMIVRHGKAGITVNRITAIEYALKHGNLVSPFADVDVSADYAEAVVGLFLKGLINGTTPNTFEPEKEISRAEFVTMLGRAVGADASATTSSFSDVTAPWCVGYVEWAYEQGLVTGVGDGKFAPNDPLTIEHANLILKRYIEQFDLSLNTIPDSDQNATRADVAVALWASLNA